MNLLRMSLLSATWLVLSGAAVADDLDAMKGNWTLVSGLDNGQKLPVDPARPVTRQVEGNRFVVKQDGKIVSQGTIKLLPKTDPPAMDVTVSEGEGKERIYRAIYDLKDDRLRLCVAVLRTERPTTFAAPPSSGLALFEWKRDKAAVPPPVVALPNSVVLEALQLRDKLPHTQAPFMVPALMTDPDKIILTRTVTEYVQKEEKFTVEVDGKLEERTRRIAVPVSKLVKQTIEAKSVKAFVVSQDGKLEALDAAKLPDLLKVMKPVMTGTDEKVDPRHLELLKPGTIYLTLPRPMGPQT